jgi:hypothetical protein
MDLVKSDCINLLLLLTQNTSGSVSGTCRQPIYQSPLAVKFSTIPVNITLVSSCSTKNYLLSSHVSETVEFQGVRMKKRFFVISFLFLLLGTGSLHADYAVGDTVTTDFTLEDVYGEWHSLFDYEGQCIVLYFFALW